MPSAWIERRATAKGGTRYRVRFRLGGRESVPRFGGSFKTKREADLRRAWVVGELAARRVPDLAALDDGPRSPTLKKVAEQWQATRVDVADGTAATYQVNLGRILDRLGPSRRRDHGRRRRRGGRRAARCGSRAGVDPQDSLDARDGARCGWRRAEPRARP